MLRQLFFIAIFFLLSQTAIHGKVYEVAGWGIDAVRINRDPIKDTDSNVLALMYIEQDQVKLLLSAVDTQEAIFPPILIDNLYIDESITNKNQIGMKATSKIPQYDKIGNLQLYISTKDNNNDIFYFNFGDIELYLVGWLIDEQMFPKLIALGTIGGATKNGAELRKSLAETIEEMANLR